MKRNETRPAAKADESLVELTLEELSKAAGGVASAPSAPSPVPVPYPNFYPFSGSNSPSATSAVIVDA